MFDENLIATLEQSLRQTRNAQNRLMARLREVEDESEHLRQEIEALENSAAQTEKAMDSFWSRCVRKSILNSEKRSRSRTITRPHTRAATSTVRTVSPARNISSHRPAVGYLSESIRGIPSITSNIEPISHRFSDRTITQACTLLLRESGKPLHVNELYNLLVAGGMRFKGNNPTISIAVSLNRNRRFRKVEPGTFDLVMREASQAASYRSNQDK